MRKKSSHKPFICAVLIEWSQLSVIDVSQMFNVEISMAVAKVSVRRHGGSYSQELRKWSGTRSDMMGNVFYRIA